MRLTCGQPISESSNQTSNFIPRGSSAAGFRNSVSSKSFILTEESLVNLQDIVSIIRQVIYNYFL